MLLQNAKELVDAQTAMLWFTSKSLPRGSGSVRGFFAGSMLNERSKVILKLTRPSQHPPAREPFLSEKEQKELMAYYYHKQQEQEKMAQDNDDSYLTREWANPHALHAQLLGQHDVAYK